MNHIEEKGIVFEVYANKRSIRNSLMDYADDIRAYVDSLNLSNYYEDPGDVESVDGLILSGQAGILEGMKYPMYGRYTSWNVQVVITEIDSDYNRSCEVALVAVGDKRLGNNLSIRCSESHRNDIEDFLRENFDCGRRVGYI